MKRITITLSDPRVELLYELLKSKNIAIEAGILLLAKDENLRVSFFKELKKVESILNGTDIENSLKTKKEEKTNLPKNNNIPNVTQSTPEIVTVKNTVKL